MRDRPGRDEVDRGAAQREESRRGESSDGACPACGARTVPIVYGMPGDTALFDAAERGELVLGGCAVEFDAPDLVCQGPVHHYWQAGTGEALVARPGA